jgi:hypothetical protein
MRPLIGAAVLAGGLAFANAANAADCTTTLVYGGEWLGETQFEVVEICFGSTSGPIDHAIWWWSNLF